MITATMKSASLFASRLASGSPLRFAASLVVVALFAGLELRATEPTLIGKPRSAADPAAIRALEDTSSRAVLARDYVTMERIWAEQFVVNNPGNYVLPNRAAVFEVFRQKKIGLYSSYDTDIDAIAFDGDLAIVMGMETVVPLEGADVGKTVRRRYTNVWRFATGGWRLIARQATLLAPDARVGPPPAGK